MAASRRKSRARRALERERVAARKAENLLLRAQLALEYEGAVPASLHACHNTELAHVLWSIRYRKYMGWAPAAYEMRNGYLHTLERAP